MPNIGFGELLVILAIAVLLFGAGNIPKVGKAIGEGIVEFKKAMNGKSEDQKKDKNQQ